MRWIELGLIGLGACTAVQTDRGAPVKRPADAIEVFRRGWRDEVVRHTPRAERATVAAIDRDMRTGRHGYRAVLESCRKSRAEVARVADETHHDLVLTGALEQLDRAGECWSVSYDGGMKLEAAGYVDPRSGELLLIWRLPEG